LKMVANETLTTREAARRLGVSVRTVQLWVESEDLQAWKTPGGHRRILASSVSEMLASRRADSGADLFRILVIEDDEPLRTLYKMTIKTWGLPIELECAASGVEGLIALGARQPDLLILDLMMRGVNGYEVAQRIRTNPQWGALEIIVVTALSSKEVARNGTLPKEVVVFGKPVPFDRLQELILKRLAERSR
jgi:excisionase family DNA binding protein